MCVCVSIGVSHCVCVYARWVDKEIRKLIKFIKECGQQDAATGKWTVKFGPLFSHTENTMEALSGAIVGAVPHRVPGIRLLSHRIFCTCTGGVLDVL